MEKAEKFWNREARKYTAGEIQDMEGYEQTLSDTKKYLNTDKTVMEIGCGSGMTALKLAPFTKEYIGTDISGEMITICNENKAETDIDNIRFLHTTLDDESMQTDSFDVILAYNVIHLLPDPAAGLQRIKDLLKPGGIFIAKTACLKQHFFWNLIVPVVATVLRVGHVHRFKAHELDDMITETGLEIIERIDYTKLLPRSFVVAKKLNS